MIPFRISYASSYASGDTLRPAPPPESDLPNGTLHHPPPSESDVPRVAPVLLERAASMERPPWVPTVPIPPEVLQMPFGEVIERIPWLPVLLQQHLYEYNPRYLYREHPELFREDFEEGMRLDLYAPTFDLAENDGPLGTRERQERYRATAERNGVPPVLTSFNEVHWNRGRGGSTIHQPRQSQVPMQTSSRPSGPMPTPNQNAGQGEHNLPSGTVIVSINQPTERMIELITRHYQQKMAIAAARDDDRRRDKERRDAYRNLYIAQWASDVYSSRKRKSDELQAEHRQEKKVKTELDDGRGGYNQPTEAGRGGYNQPTEAQPTETGRDGYNQPTEAGRGGYWQPAQDDLAHLAHLAKMARSALWRLPPNSPAPDGHGGYN